MKIKKTIKLAIHLLGIQTDNSGYLEKLISTSGGFIGIISVMLITHHYLGASGSLMIIASMGATSVLLFATPHSALAQPWAVLAGHSLSAVVGVTCRVMIHDQYLAAALAVGLAIGSMHYTRCLHPPGGATALVAVIGGKAIHSLGYQYVLTPVLINAIILLFVSVIINLPFSVRRYPIALNHYLKKKNTVERSKNQL